MSNFWILKDGNIVRKKKSKPIPKGYAKPKRRMETDNAIAKNKNEINKNPIK